MRRQVLAPFLATSALRNGYEIVDGEAIPLASLSGSPKLKIWMGYPARKYDEDKFLDEGMDGTPSASRYDKRTANP